MTFVNLFYEISAILLLAAAVGALGLILGSPSSFPCWRPGLPSAPSDWPGSAATTRSSSWPMWAYPCSSSWSASSWTCI